MTAQFEALYDPDYDQAPAEAPQSRTERALVGMALLRPRVLDEVRLDGAAFYRPDLGALWSLMQAMTEDGRAVGPMTVAAEAKAAGIRGAQHADLADYTSLGDFHGLAPQYAELVRGSAIRRNIAAIGARLVQQAEDATDPDALLEAARVVLDSASSSTDPGNTPTVAQSAHTFLDALRTPVPQVRTPWRQLDQWIGGWRPGRLYVVGARPGAGKSIVGIQAAQHMAMVTGRDVALSSLEMDASEVSQRALAAAAEVDFFALQNRHISKLQEVRLWEAQEAMADAIGSVRVDDRSSVRPGDVAAHARKVARTGRLGMVVVDYLQLMEGAGGRRSESRQQDVSAMTRAMKNLARDLQVPVIVLSQLNRGVEQRGDGSPRLSDLRESGSLEQDADVVLLLHHEERTEDNAHEPDELEMRVAKNRQGPQGKAVLSWEGKHMRVSD